MKKGTVKNFEQKKLRRKFKKLTTTTTIPDDVTVINDKRIISLNSNGLQKKINVYSIRTLDFKMKMVATIKLVFYFMDEFKINRF